MPDDCLECTSMLCEISKQASDIQQIYDDIISACIDASEGIPSTRKSNKNVLVEMKLLSMKKKRHLCGVKFG